MFDDPKKELQLLQEQLLQEENWFETELEEAKALIGDAPKKAPVKKAAKPNPNAESKPQKKAKAQEEDEPVRKTKSRVRNYANDYGKQTPPVRNTETKKPQKGIRGLVILAILETLGIVGVVAYWLLYLL